MNDKKYRFQLKPWFTSNLISRLEMDGENPIVYIEAGNYERNRGYYKIRNAQIITAKPYSKPICEEELRIPVNAIVTRFNLNGNNNKFFRGKVNLKNKSFEDFLELNRRVSMIID